MEGILDPWVSYWNKLVFNDFWSIRAIIYIYYTNDDPIYQDPDMYIIKYIYMI